MSGAERPSTNALPEHEAKSRRCGMFGHFASEAGGKRWANPQQRAAILPQARRALIEKGLERKLNPDAALRVLTAGGAHWRSEGDRHVFEQLGGPVV
jgi:hypothetical protein